MVKYIKPQHIGRFYYRWWFEKSFLFGIRYMRNMEMDRTIGIYIGCFVLQITDRPNH